MSRTSNIIEVQLGWDECKWNAGVNIVNQWQNKMLFYGIFIILFTINLTDAEESSSSVIPTTRASGVQVNVLDSKGTFSVVPDNVAVIQGNAVRLNCSGNSTRPPRWFVHHYGKHGGKIFTGSDIVPALREYFSVDTNVSGRYDLIINSTNKSHAGRYFCSEDSDIAVSAEVIIIDASPSCNMSDFKSSFNLTHTETNEEWYILWCNVSFQGNWPPTIEWRSRDIDGSVLTHHATHETIQNASLSSKLIVLKNSSLPSTIITCWTTFNLTLKPNETNATNVPGLTSDCQLTIPPARTEKQKDNRGIHVLQVVLGFVIVLLLVIVTRMAQKSALIGRCCAERNKFPEPDIVTMDGSTPTNRSHREDVDSNAYTPDAYNNEGGNNPRMKFTRQGEDGTEYVQVNFGSSNKPASAASSAKPKKKKMKQASSSDIYASIDHTVIEPEPEAPRQHRKKK